MSEGSGGGEGSGRRERSQLSRSLVSAAAHFVDPLSFFALFLRCAAAPTPPSPMFPVAAVDPEASTRELKQHLLSLGLFCLAVRLAPTVLAALGRA